LGGDKLQFERRLLGEGYSLIAGIDEVGMGCLAGPVVAAAVLLDLENIPDGIDDSKLLTPKKREALDIVIRRTAQSIGIGVATVTEIDRLNIFQAGRLAMKRAVGSLSLEPQFVLVDGRPNLDIQIPQQNVLRGDQLSVSIGAASIVAKVFRDRMMQEFDAEFPGYGFAKHKGYGSRAHRKFLQEWGPCSIHRKSFHWSPV